MEAAGGGYCTFLWMSKCDRRRFSLPSSLTVRKQLCLRSKL